MLAFVLSASNLENVASLTVSMDSSISHSKTVKTSLKNWASQQLSSLASIAKRRMAFITLLTEALPPAPS